MPCATRAGHAPAVNCRIAVYQTGQLSRHLGSFSSSYTTASPRCASGWSHWPEPWALLTAEHTLVALVLLAGCWAGSRSTSGTGSGCRGVRHSAVAINSCWQGLALPGAETACTCVCCVHARGRHREHGAQRAGHAPRLAPAQAARTLTTRPCPWRTAAARRPPWPPPPLHRPAPPPPPARRRQPVRAQRGPRSTLHKQQAEGAAPGNQPPRRTWLRPAAQNAAASAQARSPCACVQRAHTGALKGGLLGHMHAHRRPRRPWLARATRAAKANGSCVVARGVGPLAKFHAALRAEHSGATAHCLHTCTAAAPQPRLACTRGRGMACPARPPPPPPRCCRRQRTS